MSFASLAFLRTQSDQRLVALARAGHERAFEAIVERYRRPLLAHGRRLLPEARAEDALQQALLAAWTALRRGDDVRQLGPWLHRIVHNTALNAQRAAGYDHQELHEALSWDPAPQEELERRLVVRRTLAGLAALPDRQREALLRTAIEGRPHEEVADALGVSPGALRQLVHRARTTLRAAATAVTPLPVATWVAELGTRAAPVSERIAELAAGAGSAGVGAVLAKASVAGVVAGGAVLGGPVLVEQTRWGRPPAAQAVGFPAAAPERHTRGATPAVVGGRSGASGVAGRADPARLGVSGTASPPARRAGGSDASQGPSADGPDRAGPGGSAGTGSSGGRDGGSEHGAGQAESAGDHADVGAQGTADDEGSPSAGDRRRRDGHGDKEAGVGRSASRDRSGGRDDSGDGSDGDKPHRDDKTGTKDRSGGNDKTGAKDRSDGNDRTGTKDRSDGNDKTGAKDTSGGKGDPGTRATGNSDADTPSRGGDGESGGQRGSSGTTDSGDGGSSGETPCATTVRDDASSGERSEPGEDSRDDANECSEASTAA